jgi:hypothetical protein
MYEFLSYGAGVNSTALLVLRKPKVAVFANTSGEWPETYGYIHEVVLPYCAAHGIEFIQTMHQKWTLEEMALHDHLAPARTMRWCSDKFKVRIIRQWLERNGKLPCVQMIGFDSNEVHRAQPSGTPDIVNIFPLIEMGIDRPACKQIILDAGLPLPGTPGGKSGCFFCPFQSKGNFIELKQAHPDLFERAARIEANASNFDQGFYLAGDKPLADWIKTGRIRHDEDQLGLFRCACYSGDMTHEIQTANDREAVDGAHGEPG